MASGSQYVSQLNEYAQKLRLKPPEYEDLGSTGPDHMKEFTQRVRFNGKVFPEGVGRTKQIARHNAAKKAFEILMKQTNEPLPAPKATEIAGQDVNHGSGQEREKDEFCKKTTELSVNDTSFTKKTDYVSIINKYCQTKTLLHNYIEVSREGPSHNFQFSYQLEINKQQYPVGKGKNIKDAKQMAAQLAWSALQEQSDWDSKVSLGSAVSQDEASEITSTSATSSSLLEPELSAQSTQSSGSDSIQFKDSSKSASVQNTSSDKETGLEKNNGHCLNVTLEMSRFISDFDCIERLGKGSYGSVYKARHKVLDRYRAVKEIRSKDLDKSQQEVKVLSDLDHPNIVRYYSCWLQDIGYKSVVKSKAKFLFIEMELCSGGTLRHWIHEKNKESSENSRREQSLELAQQILNGVEYIHRKKLIHRDLKPENILFGQDGNVRIGDFGLATQDDDDEEFVERTADRGTRSYMAPEQVGVNYDRKVDIFALGLIFFELFCKTGTGHERVKIWENVRHQNLPEEFTGSYPIESLIIKTMLRENPEKRPEASAVKTDMKKWIGTPDTDRTI